jgi:dUTP pyrophosphatase
MISCWNRGNAILTIAPGDRIAQLLLVPVGRARLRVVDAFDPSSRGEGGFGSTGIG